MKIIVKSIPHQYRNKYMYGGGGNSTTIINNGGGSTTIDTSNLVTKDDFASYFYKDADGNIHSPEHFVGDKSVSAYGVSDSTMSGGDGHSHSNKSVIDGITSTNVSNWNTASTNSHTHTNKTVLDTIT